MDSEGTELEKRFILVLDFAVAVRDLSQPGRHEVNGDAVQSSLPRKATRGKV